MDALNEWVRGKEIRKWRVVGWRERMMENGGLGGVKVLFGE